MIHTLPTLDVTRLAADYSAAIRAAHSTLELDAIRERNAREDNPDIDHAHDYTDANDLLLDAIRLQIIDARSLADYATDAAIAQQRGRAAGYRLQRILVACEFSGIVRDAFTARGHSVTSCDTLPTETPGAHYRGDVRDILGDGWHMLVSFPPCTYLTSSQLWRCNPKHDPTGERAAKSDAALDFIRDLMTAPIHARALENPRGRIGSAIRKADQEIHPYQFGHDASKTTGLWLDNLPLLVADPADYIAPRRTTYKGRAVDRWANQSPCGADNKSPGPNRWRDRSRTFTGIARAMADTWGGIIGRTQPGNTAPHQLALL